MRQKFYLLTILIFSNLIMSNIYAKPEFMIKNLSDQDIENMVKTNILKTPYIFDPSRLKMLTISYYDFNGKVHNDGKMMVLDAAANYVISVFKNLYGQKFPINQIKLMNEFNGDDNLALTANNTSCLNQRPITGQTNLSIHSYGLAIDINPVQNPYIAFDFDNGIAKYAPIAGAKFANRAENRPGKPNRSGFAESIKQIFYQNGFNIWGGNWDYPIDYQHFQTSSILAQLLITMDANDAQEFFKLHVKFLQNQPDELAIYMQKHHYPDLTNGYLQDKKRFMITAGKITMTIKNE